MNAKNRILEKIWAEFLGYMEFPLFIFWDVAKQFFKEINLDNSPARDYFLRIENKGTLVD